MADESVQPLPQEPTLSEQMRDNFFGKLGNEEQAQPPAPTNSGEPPKPNDSPAPAPAPESEEEIFDESEYLKQKFGTDDIAAILKEREEYGQLKNKPKEEVQFADEQSKELYNLLVSGKKTEIRDFLDRQHKIETFLGANVDGESAEQIIKLGMSLKHKDLTEKEIARQYNKQFSYPKEPVQGDDEEDTEFTERHNEWKQQIDDINQDKIIQAKLMRPELEKYKSELVLPKIDKDESGQPQTPSEEDLKKFAEIRESFVKKAADAVSGFSGFNTEIKDKEGNVELSVPYNISEDQKKVISGMVNTFAENNLDANAIFAHRWLNKDLTVNTDQVIADLVRLQFGEDISQKQVNDAANKRLDNYLKEKKNTNLNGSPSVNQFQITQPDLSEKMQKSFWGEN